MAVFFITSTPSRAPQRAGFHLRCVRMVRASQRAMRTCLHAAVALLSLSGHTYAQGQVDSVNPGGDSEKKIAVQVRAAKLREAPKHFAEGIADLQFGEQLAVVSHTAGWYRARTLSNGAQDPVLGFLHESAATTRRIVLSTQQVSLADLAVDEAQVYLAGKGFNEQVERGYSKDPTHPNYAALHGLQSTLKLTAADTRAFVEEGQLASDE